MKQIHGCNCKPDTWSAILDTMPPEPARLHVTGTCTCPTRGFNVRLVKAEPQGINWEDLILELIADGPTQPANQVMTDYDVEYRKANSPQYRTVTIRSCGITIPVEVVR